jgi:hypothetical protein
MAKKFGGTRRGCRAVLGPAWAVAAAVSVTMGSGVRGPVQLDRQCSVSVQPGGKKSHLTQALFGQPE